VACDTLDTWIDATAMVEQYWTIFIFKNFDLKICPLVSFKIRVINEKIFLQGCRVKVHDPKYEI
jgi:hypothetical protein